MTDEHIPLGLRFAIIGRGFKRVLDERLRHMGITGVQFGVLGAVLRLERKGEAEINQHELERIMNVTHPTMTEIIKRLERNGYIACTRSESDRRSKCIRSTELARRLCSEVSAAEEYAKERMFSGVSEEEQQLLLAITDKLLKNALSLKGENRD